MFKRILAGALLFAAPAFAQMQEIIEVTATRVAEDVQLVPASVTIIGGDELRARNATDLASALATVAGVSAVGGSDAGPGTGVPEMWGLREVDAFLLVVDGVPWGGAFNPDLPTVDLTGVDRIEIVRGSAPVMYGATSFVGVIHVIHRAAGTADGEAQAFVGNYGSGGVAAYVPLTQSMALRQSITASVQRRGFDDDRTRVDRVHALYRAARGNFHFDGDISLVRQDPSSPHPRQGASLSTRVPVGANHNPDHAHLDQNRLHLAGGWSTDRNSVTLALTRSDHDIRRGFLTGVNENALNAIGFEQDREVTDVYFDAHTVRQIAPQLRVIGGIDHLYGDAHAENDIFDYHVALAGGPSSGETGDEETELDDTRNFSGLYGVVEWTPRPRLRVDAGARLNHTREERNEDTKSLTRGGGSVGVTWMATDALSLFADYRNTFKPAAIDFGPETEGGILDVETADSWEAGIKGAHAALRWQLTAFLMNFSNLVVPAVRNGLPALENAGNERFKGLEAEVDWQFTRAIDVAMAYSYHDARFRDYVRDFGGVPTQLRGKRFEMSPYHLAALGVTYDAGRLWNWNALMNYTGERYLNKRNTAMAEAYTLWSFGIGRRVGRGEVRLDARNVTDERPPVAESELGDAQYYRLNGRELELGYRMRL